MPVIDWIFRCIAPLGDLLSAGWVAVSPPLIGAKRKEKMMNLDDIPMPYACTTVPQAGAAVLQIHESHRNRAISGASTIFEVPDGVSIVTVTWDGPQGVDVSLRRNDGSRSTVSRIESGGGAVLTTSHSVHHRSGKRNPGLSRFRSLRSTLGQTRVHYRHPDQPAVAGAVV